MIAVPIVAATASAWWFQYNAMRAAGLAVLLACTVATSLESLGLTFAGLAHKARTGQDSAAPYRIGMWAIVFIAAAVNYRHGSPGTVRTTEGVSLCGCQAAAAGAESGRGCR
ncbi:DUF2637 domain-containing protein [Amycolatopsis aidingensis]|uniref:DUF2637 domain-containing protein n=1 Tax=Amycolatopsis aidingensis TaxID=2842453 RepID=UPI001C0D87E9